VASYSAVSRGRIIAKDEPSPVSIERVSGKPSPRLLEWVDLIAAHAPGPILDAPCGMGRNAVPFAKRGCDVICADTDRASLDAVASYSTDATISGALRPLELDLLGADLPFAPNSLGAVVNVHFLAPSLARRLASFVRSGGFIYVESYENKGGNYLQLPKAGEFHTLFSDFEMFVYVEKKAGPPSVDAVTFHCLARKP
jgi:SAM-dependent methyltransferase